MQGPSWIKSEVAVAIHAMQIAEHGGQQGVRDMALLDSAMNRAKNIFNYEGGDVFTLAAAYACGIIKNHPFFDGNKRTGYVLCRMFLELNGYSVSATKEAKYQIFYNVAAGQISEEELIEWLKANSVKA